jgi:hypothetical protein
MKKRPFNLLLTYLIAMAIALFGYWIDADEPINSLAYQMFEVFAVSLVIYVVMLLGFLVSTFLNQLYKRIVKSNR